MPQLSLKATPEIDKSDRSNWGPVSLALGFKFRGLPPCEPDNYLPTLRVPVRDPAEVCSVFTRDTDGIRRPNPLASEERRGPIEPPKLSFQQQYRILRALETDEGFRRDFLRVLGLAGGCR